MKLLLDTATFLWLIAEPERLTAAVHEACIDSTNDVYLSAVSAWEIAVKHAIGRLPLPDPPDRFVPRERDRHGIESLALDADSNEPIVESDFHLELIDGVLGIDRLLLIDRQGNDFALGIPIRADLESGVAFAENPLVEESAQVSSGGVLDGADEIDRRHTFPTTRKSPFDRRASRRKIGDSQLGDAMSRDTYQPLLWV